jgi:hypothetical protein
MNEISNTTDLDESKARAARWQVWWKGVVDTANATPEGQIFNASNFHVEHTGGGCTAWERPVDDTGWTILITDSEGLGHSLEGDHCYRPGFADCWLIGAHDNDGEGTECEEADTAERAIEIANELHERLKAQVAMTKTI